MKSASGLLRTLGILTTLVTISAPAHAVLVYGAIDSTQNTYSLVHEGANPAGTSGPGDWLRFADGDAFVFDYASGMISTVGSQSYTLQSDNGALAVLDIISLVIDTSGSREFASGAMDYALNGVAGTFLFDDRQYGNSLFNSTSLQGGVFSAYGWGGDDLRDLGIDISFHGLVPEPGTLLLFALGLLGIRATRGRC